MRVFALIGAVLAALHGPALAAGGDDTEARWRTGMLAVKAAMREPAAEAREAHLDTAIEAFRAILVHRPELVRVRLELARAFFLKGEDTLARKHFESVLAGDVSEAVAANVKRFLDAIRARKRWRVHIGMSAAPDSNVNEASEDRTIILDTPFGRLPFQATGAPESGLGFSLWGGGEYLYPLAPRWRLRVGADASTHEYAGHEFDRASAAAHIGPQWLIDARTAASLLATVGRQWKAGTPDADTYGARIEATRRLGSQWMVSARASVAQRGCRDCDWMDGPQGDVTLGASYKPLSVLRLDGSAAYRWERPEARHLRNRTQHARVGATLTLPAGFTVGANAAMHWTAFEGDGGAHLTLDGSPRRDRMRVLSVSVENRAITVLGFSPRLSFVNESRETNAQLLSYERNRVELSFVKAF